MTKVEDKFNKVLWIYLFLNPFLDIFSGGYIYLQYGRMLKLNDATIGTTPSLYIRMAMLLFFVVYLLVLKNKKAVLTALPMIAAFLLSVFSEYHRLHAVHLMTDAQYFAKFFYNVLILFVYAAYFRSCSADREALLTRFRRMLCIVSFILVAGILIPYIFHIGFFTYADRFGYRGFRGIYYSGNDITAVLMLVTPITLCNYLAISRREKQSFKTWAFYGLPPVLSTLCLLLVGTKTAYMALGILILLALLYSIWRKRRVQGDRAVLCIGVYLLSVLLSMGLLSLLARQSVMATILNSIGGFNKAANESMQTLVLSGRQTKLREAAALYGQGGVLTWLFGLGRGSVTRVIEMDVFEVLFYYGVFGAVCMLWLYCKLGFSFLRSFFKHIDFQTLGAFVSLGTCVCYFVIAGHVLFSVTSGFFFSLTVVYGCYLFYEENRSTGCSYLFEAAGTGNGTAPAVDP